MMVDGATSRVTRGASLEATYRAQLALTPRVDRQVRGSILARLRLRCVGLHGPQHAGRSFALVGDAGSTLNPLSSFGVKKALASAWLAAVVTHTCLVHPERAEQAQDFFSRWASQVWQLNLQRSREFAVEALDRHRAASGRHRRRGRGRVTNPARRSRCRDVGRGARGIARLREADTVVFSRRHDPTFVSAPIVRRT